MKNNKKFMLIVVSGIKNLGKIIFIIKLILWLIVLGYKVVMIKYDGYDF